MEVGELLVQVDDLYTYRSLSFVFEYRLFRSFYELVLVVVGVPVGNHQSVQRFVKLVYHFVVAICPGLLRIVLALFAMLQSCLRGVCIGYRWDLVG